MSDVYVVGIDMIKFMKAGTGGSVESLGSKAALMALEDCGLKIQQMEALYCGNLYQANAMVGQRILQQIGQTGIPVVNTSNACATASAPGCGCCSSASIPACGPLSQAITLPGSRTASGNCSTRRAWYPSRLRMRTMSGCWSGATG